LTHDILQPQFLEKPRKLAMVLTITHGYGGMWFAAVFSRNI